MKDAQIIEPATARRGTNCEDGWETFPLKESKLGPPPREGGKELYGGFYELGVSIQWHDFQTPSPFDWARDFHPESLELCLNLTGQGLIRCGALSMELDALAAGFFVPAKDALSAWRKPGQRHRYITIEFSARFLRDHLGQCDGALNPLVEQFVFNGPCSAGLGATHRLATQQEQLLKQFLQPPTAQGARRLWYQSKVLELMAEFFFERPGQEEPFCDRQKRVARQRVDKVIALLRAELAQPLELDQLGRKVGCSPFHLSRTFSKEMGMTISQYLRKARMERAAELLRSGRYNVTEAALEVGYSSLSHFSQAFCQVMGCCPGLYPLKKPAS